MDSDCWKECKNNPKQFCNNFGWNGSKDAKTAIQHLLVSEWPLEEIHGFQPGGRKLKPPQEYCLENIPPMHCTNP